MQSTGKHLQEVIKKCPPQRRAPDCAENVVEKGAGVFQAGGNGSASYWSGDVLEGRWIAFVFYCFSGKHDVFHPATLCFVTCVTIE